MFNAWRLQSLLGVGCVRALPLSLSSRPALLAAHQTQTMALAFVRCLDQSQPCAWDDYGRRVSVDARDDVESDEERFHYGGLVGTPNHRCLSASELEELLDFQLINRLVAESRSLLRELPLLLFDPSALEDGLPKADDAGTLVYASHKPVYIPLLCFSLLNRPASISRIPLSLTAAAKHVREGAFMTELTFVAPVEGAGHGLFAAVDLRADTFLGEYVGILARDSTKIAAAGDDEYAMDYPAEGIHISGKEMGSLLRFINHGSSGAANVRMHTLKLDGAYITSAHSPAPRYLPALHCCTIMGTPFGVSDRTHPWS